MKTEVEHFKHLLSVAWGDLATKEEKLKKIGELITDYEFLKYSAEDILPLISDVIYDRKQENT